MTLEVTRRNYADDVLHLSLLMVSIMSDDIHRCAPVILMVSIMSMTSAIVHLVPPSHATFNGVDN